jgi:hypothetical protein
MRSRALADPTASLNSTNACSGVGVGAGVMGGRGGEDRGQHHSFIWGAPLVKLTGQNGRNCIPEVTKGPQRGGSSGVGRNATKVAGQQDIWYNRYLRDCDQTTPQTAAPPQCKRTPAWVSPHSLQLAAHILLAGRLQAAEPAPTHLAVVVSAPELL